MRCVSMCLAFRSIVLCLKHKIPHVQLTNGKDISTRASRRIAFSFNEKETNWPFANNFRGAQTFYSQFMVSKQIALNRPFNRIAFYE